MWNVTNLDITMTEGDWGIKLPVAVSGVTITASDEMKLVIKGAKNGPVLIEKTFSNIQNSTIDLELTEAESALLEPGKYVYALDWYQDGAFLCNLIPLSNLKVVDKA